MAEDAAKKTADAPAPAVQRQPLAERSVEDALALERQLPAAEQQQLQAGSDEFLALWRPANSGDPAGVVIIVPGAGETPDWPQGVGPMRRKFPDVNWSSLSLSLPDLQSQAPQVRSAEAAPPAPTTSTSQPTPPDAAASVEKGIAAEADNAAASAEAPDPMTADAERIFARIEAAVAFAQQHKARSIVLIGQGSGAYWSARYLAERQPPHVQKLVMVAPKTPSNAPQDIDALIPTIKIPTADVFYNDRQPAKDAAQRRLQASKRQPGSQYHQVSLGVLPDRDAQQEQLFRRVRGWVSPSDPSKPDA